ncbi:GNAT family N-acetyltransferase [Dictyobacter formicarum]|uniref:N-acetyltransferase YhfO n=1 Tax=Dictyobacter formicarum TaxID=2778368 RepID=A0ABQ3VAQ9_9CHLR|nr:GNAT family N-acetyltransferase [Dictyobacter formicarum]GHO83237.1 putative N-acetyltransferase YhfO [Dictyobacter formicarum]
MDMRKPTFEITRATIDNVALIAPLFDAYRQFYQQATDVAAAQNFLTARLQENSSVIFLALSLESDENGIRQVYGFTQLYPSFSSISLKPLWILNDLFVIPEARRSGVGKALLDRAREFAIETQARGLTLKTAVNNSSAQALYEAAGWQRDGQFYSYNLYVS